jgi:hypothetical protein
MSNDLIVYAAARAAWLAAVDAVEARRADHAIAAEARRIAAEHAEQAAHGEHAAHMALLTANAIEARLWDALIDATPRPAVEGTPYEQT